MACAGTPIAHRDSLVSALREQRRGRLPPETNEQRREMYKMMYDLARESIELMQPGRTFYRPQWALNIGVSRNASLHAVRKACADGLLTYTGRQYVRQRLPSDG